MTNNQNDDILVLDGSMGEGGGQILRTALALSACMNRAFVLENIRAGRGKPGLLRQHLTAVNAVASICKAKVEGAELGSKKLRFIPGQIHSGHFHFSIGSAGSAMLVLQTVLYPLMFADAPSTVIIEGGTHNSMAPPFEFIDEVFLPLLRKMGARVELSLLRAGFYPAGGGQIHIKVNPCPSLTPLRLMTRGEIVSQEAVVILSALPEDIAERQLRLLKRKLLWPQSSLQWRSQKSVGPGNVVYVKIQCTQLAEMFTAFGQKGVRAERVAGQVADAVKRYLMHNAPVDEHLADQLLLPMAFAGNSEFVTTKPSMHTQTNVDVITAFTDRTFEFQPMDAEYVKVSTGPV